MRFAHPQLLWLLALFPPLLLLFFWWSWQRRQQLVTQFIQARLLPGLTVGISPARTKIRLGCVLGAVICVILALARVSCRSLDTPRVGGQLVGEVGGCRH